MVKIILLLAVPRGGGSSVLLLYLSFILFEKTIYEKVRPWHIYAKAVYRNIAIQPGMPVASHTRLERTCDKFLGFLTYIVRAK